jgi:hypothetical protein
MDTGRLEGASMVFKSSHVDSLVYVEQQQWVDKVPPIFCMLRSVQYILVSLEIRKYIGRNRKAKT